jgi:hypothetical protein
MVPNAWTEVKAIFCVGIPLLRSRIGKRLWLKFKRLGLKKFWTTMYVDGQLRFLKSKLQDIFVGRCSTKECTHHHTLPHKKSETNAKIYESALITECKASTMLYFYNFTYSGCMLNFTFFTLSQFYRFQASLNHRANACSCFLLKSYCLTLWRDSISRQITNRLPLGRPLHQGKIKITRLCFVEQSAREDVSLSRFWCLPKMNVMILLRNGRLSTA